MSNLPKVSCRGNRGMVCGCPFYRPRNPAPGMFPAIFGKSHPDYSTDVVPDGGEDRITGDVKWKIDRYGIHIEINAGTGEAELRIIRRFFFSMPAGSAAPRHFRTGTPVYEFQKDTDESSASVTVFADPSFMETRINRFWYLGSYLKYIDDLGYNFENQFGIDLINGNFDSYSGFEFSGETSRVDVKGNWYRACVDFDIQCEIFRGGKLTIDIPFTGWN